VVRLEKAGTMTSMLVALDADTGIITAGSPFSGVNTTEIAKVPAVNPVPVMVSGSNGLAEASLSAVIVSTVDAAVMVTEAAPDFVVSSVLVAVMLTGFVVGTALGAL
jgi:hypothetical protein